MKRATFGFLLSLLAGWAFAVFKAFTDPHGVVPVWFYVWFGGSFLGWLVCCVAWWRQGRKS